MFNRNLVSKPSLKGVLYRFTEKWEWNKEQFDRIPFSRFVWSNIDAPSVKWKKNRHYVQLIKSMTSLDCRRCNDISNLSIFFSKKIWASLFLSASVSILINTLIPATGFAEKKPVLQELRPLHSILNAWEIKHIYREIRK
jgi:hypothetical protein